MGSIESNGHIGTGDGGGGGTSISVHHSPRDVNIAHDERLLAESVGNLHPRCRATDAGMKDLAQCLLREVIEARINAGLLRSHRPRARPGCRGLGLCGSAEQSKGYHRGSQWHDVLQSHSSQLPYDWSGSIPNVRCTPALTISVASLRLTPRNWARASDYVAV